MKLLSRAYRWFVNSPIRTKLVLVFAFTMFMVAFVNIYMHISINSIVSTIDNMVKGAAGQAIQNMNIMYGIDESTGLLAVPTSF